MKKHHSDATTLSRSSSIHSDSWADEFEKNLVSSPLDLQRVRFGYFQADAHEVFVAGSFNEWQPRATPLKCDSFGDWSVELLLPRGEYRYRFVVDGEWCDDPSAQQTVPNPFGGFDAVMMV